VLEFVGDEVLYVRCCHHRTTTHTGRSHLSVFLSRALVRVPGRILTVAHPLLDGRGCGEAVRYF
jgi:hypothetical protein